MFGASGLIRASEYWQSHMKFVSYLATKVTLVLNCPCPASSPRPPRVRDRFSEEDDPEEILDASNRSVSTLTNSECWYKCRYGSVALYSSASWYWHPV